MPEPIPRRSAARALLLDAIRDPALITHLWGEGNYCWVHYADGRPAYLLCRTLKVVQGYLPDFLRVSKPHLVNPAFIDYLLVGVSTTIKDLVLTTGGRLRLSRRRYRLLKGQLAAYPHWPTPAATDAQAAEPMNP